MATSQEDTVVGVAEPADHAASIAQLFAAGPSTSQSIQFWLDRKRVLNGLCWSLLLTRLNHGEAILSVQGYLPWDTAADSIAPLLLHKQPLSMQTRVDMRHPAALLPSDVREQLLVSMYE